MDFDNHNSQIFDFTAADLSLIKEKDTIIPAAHDLGASITNSNVKIASVATDEHAINVCKMYMGISDKHDSPWNFKICSTITEAQEWIQA